MHSHVRSLASNHLVLLFLRLSLGVIFIAASLGEISDPQAFVNLVTSYNILPESLAKPFGLLLPWIEIAIGSLLILGIFSRLAAIISMVLTTSFIVANFCSLVCGTGTSCGCFGAAIPLTHTQSLLLDGVMLVLALPIAFCRDRSWFAIPRVPRSAFAGGLAILLVMGSFLPQAAPVLANAGTAELQLTASQSETPDSRSGNEVAADETKAEPATIAATGPIDQRIAASLDSGKPVFLFFYADWCGYCKKEKPIIDNLEQRYSGQITFLSLNNEKEAEALKEFGITGFPTMYLITGTNPNGSFIQQKFQGYTDETKLKAAFDRTISGDASPAQGTVSFIALPVTSSPTEVSVEAKINASLELNKPVFLYFYSDQCGYCQKQKPIVDSLENEFSQDITFIWVNVKVDRQTTKEFGVTAYPTMFLITDTDSTGSFVQQKFVGFTNDAKLTAGFDRIISGCETDKEVVSFVSVPQVSDFNLTLNQIEEDVCPEDPDKTAPGICGCGVADTNSDYWPTMIPPDDGLPDCIDGCPTDYYKGNLGQCGCFVSEADSDGDGTPDCLDGCPGDPNSTTAPCSCGEGSVDSDRDGTPDCADLCPLDPNKKFGGTCRCGNPDIDADRDGAPSCIDHCDNNPDLVFETVCGCEIPVDTDGDGYFDCQEACPLDPDKLFPGECGCGAPDIDSDGDGVYDCEDLCPTDIYKMVPGVCGCGAADTDSDRDGTADCNDLCPNDPAKIAPGLCGCEVADSITDTDGDGVPDCIDQCPGLPNTDSDGDGEADCLDGCPTDPNKAAPGSCGCGFEDIDTDSDGASDCIDGCPINPYRQDYNYVYCAVGPEDCNYQRLACGSNPPRCYRVCYGDVCVNPAEVCSHVDSAGNPIDTDSDSLPDYFDSCPLVSAPTPDGCPIDLCPDDPDKVDPGVCGCGVADTDTDRDGIADCNDGCLSDPNKVAPGVCGCGVSEIDSDLDGTPDCQDGCLSDPDKIIPGICGCGVTEDITDTDGDGQVDCIDPCPNDPTPECSCDPFGTDSDGDGTPDCNDDCHLDPNKVAPGICGCGVPDTDSDGDGVADCLDSCPNEPNKVDPGVCGCGVVDIDTDIDLTPDCIDLCPIDSGKTEPGICGCSVPDTDSDNDGTPDCQDACPVDPGKITPGECGCGIADIDTDGDGQANCTDLCPADPNKVAPGACGCGVPDTDSDGDGTPDCNDDCPLDPNKVEPGICGCGVADNDSDNDGTADCLDACPYDPAKIVPGVCGCGVIDVDTDGDGLSDCFDYCPNVAAPTPDGCPEDLCPDDPYKTAPEVCGCGVADTDSDGDGTPDCNDDCPLDPNKVEPGICGCGIPETDSDGDGTPDCNDDCPLDPNKVEPGICGCGITDTDSDGDGTPDCNDDCPLDPNKVAPGACGCGIPDTDSDGDGISDCNEVIADSQSITTAEDTPLPITLSGSDVDGVTLTYTVVAGPGHGSLSGIAPSVTYTPAANYNGLDSFTFKVNDGTADSVPAAVTISVTSVNDAPFGENKLFAYPEDFRVEIRLFGYDVEPAGLDFSIVSGPSHGTLGAIELEPGAPIRINLDGTYLYLQYAYASYTLEGNYFGIDSVSYRVTDHGEGSSGLLASEPAIISITILPVNDAPSFTKGADVTVDEDSSAYSSAWATNISAGPPNEADQVLTFTVTSNNSSLFSVQPDIDEISGNLTFTPAANAAGSATVTVTLSDDGGTDEAYNGVDTSAPQTFTITVTPVNDAPVAYSQSVTTSQNARVLFALTGFDTDGDTLRYALVEGPAHGELYVASVEPDTGYIPGRDYRPEPDYYGTDSFAFKVDDGTEDSAPATVTITITPVLYAQDDNYTTPEDQCLSVPAPGFLGNDYQVTGTLSVGAQSGNYGGLDGSLHYCPPANWYGTDSFTYWINYNNGGYFSDSATVTITVTPVNDAPTADAQSVTTSEDTPVAITLSGDDIENSSLTYSIVTPPTNGDLSGSAPSVTYTPAANYSGADSFTFKVNDGSADSNVATASVTVTPTYTLTIDAVNGTVARSPDQTKYDPGTSVQLTAIPAIGYSFVNWTGDIDTPPDTANPITVIMDGDKTIIANFSINTFNVNTSVTGGHGTASASPTTVDYNDSSTVTLTPEIGYHLSALTDNDWDVLSEVTSGSYTINGVTADHNVVAAFAIDNYTVSFDTQGDGTIASQNVNYGGLIAQPPDPAKRGYFFGGWYKESDCTHPWNFATDTVAGDMTLYAKWVLGSAARANTITTLDSSANPAIMGQSVNFTARISSNSPEINIPTGMVTFNIDGTNLVPVALSGDAATYTISTLAEGSHTIQATYDGDTNFYGSTGSLSQTVQTTVYNTVTTITASTSSAKSGQKVTLTATVKVEGNAKVIPTGTVTFYDGDLFKPLDGAITLNSGGKANLTITKLPKGTHLIYAVYTPSNSTFNYSQTVSPVRIVIR